MTALSRLLSLGKRSLRERYQFSWKHYHKNWKQLDTVPFGDWLSLSQHLVAYIALLPKQRKLPESVPECYTVKTRYTLIRYKY